MVIERERKPACVSKSGSASAASSGWPGAGYCSAYSAAGKAAKVMHGLGRGGGHDLHVSGLPVRRHHQHGLDAGEVLPNGTQMAPSCPGSMAKVGAPCEMKKTGARGKVVFMWVSREKQS